MRAITGLKKVEKTLNQYYSNRDSKSLKKLRKMLRKVKGAEEFIMEKLVSDPCMIRVFPKNRINKVVLTLIRDGGINEFTLQLLCNLKEKERCKVLKKCSDSDALKFYRRSSNYKRYEADAWTK